MPPPAGALAWGANFIKFIPQIVEPPRNAFSFQAGIFGPFVSSDSHSLCLDGHASRVCHGPS